MGNRIVLETRSRLEQLKKLKGLREPFIEFFQAKSRPTVAGQEYLLGLRGILVVQSFLWVFLQTFAPTSVKGAANVDGPDYQDVLRKTLSVIFWNEDLLYSFFIFLSARTLCIPFFAEPKKSVVASAVVRRGLRLWIPISVALALVTIAFSQAGLDYIDEFRADTGNISIRTPFFITNPVVYFNSVFNLFWTTGNFATQSGALAFPAQTLWIVNVVYSQSFTVFMVMVAVPYTRPTWRVQMAVAFILSAWWVQAWAWYTITGMLFADAVMHMDFRARASKGLPIWRTDWRLPVWMPAAMILLSGLVMQYLWTDLRPDMAANELLIHTPLYSNTMLNYKFDTAQPQARADNYLFIVGIFLLLDTYRPLQALLDNRVCLFLGARSLSKCIYWSLSNIFKSMLFADRLPTGYFLTQSLIIYTCGIKLFTQIQPATSTDGAIAASFFLCVVVTLATAELFHRLVDQPSQKLARGVFDWIRR